MIMIYTLLSLYERVRDGEGNSFFFEHNSNTLSIFRGVGFTTIRKRYPTILVLKEEGRNTR